MQFTCTQEEQQQGCPIMESPTQQASFLCQYPVLGPRRWSGAGRRSSPGPALCDLHNNNSGSEGSQLSHGAASPAATTAAAAANGDASSWEVRAFAEDSASCSGQWPPRSYACSFCRREFRTAQALGGHMNVHRRERAQANNMAILRNSAQQAAAAAAGPPTPQLAALGPQGQWCLYSPPIGVGINPAALAASPDRRAFFYSSLAPGGAIIAMTNSSGGSSQFTSLSSAAPSPSEYKTVAGSMENHNNNVTGNMLNSANISSSRLSTSPLSSPISQNSISSDSSVVTKSGSGSQGEAGDPTHYRSTSSVSGDSCSFIQKLQSGAFQPYQPSPFAHEATPLVTQELIQLRPQHHTSTLFSKSMVIRGPADDAGFLDLELRLGPA